ncbi:hypothetical protein D4764_05G0010760 [Takifugu flavidus]|uniref:Uncharacterized protein n=1 Tax=Takifugu flavidus TaxID=433684 RepID=A0A5C6N104_9TELE|nr:hypothetical protein D4764_05G0010760 [Takifugu flavidus]
MFWKNITWSLSNSEGDDDDDDDGDAYLLAADIRKTPDVPPVTDLKCTGSTSSNSLSNTGPKDWTKVQMPDLSPDLIYVNHEHLPGDSKCSSFVSAPYTIAKQKAKWKSNQCWQPIPADGPQVSQGIASPDNSEARQSRHTGRSRKTTQEITLLVYLVKRRGEERRGEERRGERGEERRGEETMTQWGDRGLSAKKEEALQSDSKTKIYNS